MAYRLTKAAEADYRALYIFGIEKFGEQQADDYCDGLDALFENLARHPEMGAAVDHIRRGYRRAVHHRHSVYYVIEDGGVLIVRILGQQDPSDQFDD